MKRLSSKILCLLICAILALGNQTIVKAENQEDLGKIVEGSKLTNEQTAESSFESVLRGNILNQGLARISNNGNGSVNIYGAVFGSVVCDKLILSLTLQRYSGGYWYNVTMYDNTVYNQASFSKSYNVNVTKGYYYRVKAACVAQKGSTTESQAPVSDGIWIS